MMQRNVWPVVVIIVAALAAVTALAIAGAATDATMQVIATAVVPTVTMILVGERVASKVDRVHEQVNGRMSELIRRADNRGE